jgi:hypothetical protein
MVFSFFVFVPLTIDRLQSELDDETAFATAKLFLISSEKPYIGEMSKLYDHIKKNLPSNHYSAIMLLKSRSANLQCFHYAIDQGQRH